MRHIRFLFPAKWTVCLASAVWLVTAPAEAAPCQPEPTNMLVPYGELTTCELTPSADTDLFRFSGRSGDRVLVEALHISGPGFFPHIKVIAPDGTDIIEAEIPARWDAVLAETGVYTVIVSDNNLDVGQYSLLVSCIVGDCGKPVLRLTLTGCTACQPGDQFTVEARWTNAASRNVRTEIKAGLMLPNGTRSNLLGNKHLEATLPAGLDFTGNLLSFAWPPGLTPGTWTFEGTLLDPDLGEIYSRDVNVFTVEP